MNARSYKSKLTLTVESSVSERAKVFADANGTSVSALVESYLSELGEGGGVPNPTAAAAEDLEALQAFDGIILTAPGKRLEVEQAVGMQLAYLDNGWLVADRHAVHGAAYEELRGRIRRSGYRITRILMVDEGTIARVFSQLVQEASEAEARQRFLDVVSSAAEAQATEIEIVSGQPDHDAAMATIRFRIGSDLVLQEELTRSEGLLLMEAAFSMDDSNFYSYRLLEIQVARLSWHTVDLPKGVSRLVMHFSPTGNRGRMLVARLIRSDTDVQPFADYSRDALHLETLLEVSTAPGGLNIVASPDEGERSQLVASLLTQCMRSEHVGRRVIWVSDSLDMQVPGITFLPIVGAQNEVERRDRIRQAITAAMHMNADVLVFEIGDSSCASLAVQAALTGIVVYGLLQATRRQSVMTRLHSLGVDDSCLPDPSCLQTVTVLRRFHLRDAQPAREMLLAEVVDLRPFHRVRQQNASVSDTTVELFISHPNPGNVFRSFSQQADELGLSQTLEGQLW